MNLDKVYVVDIEAKGMLPILNTKDDIHVVSVGYQYNGKWHIKSTKNPDDIQKVVGNPNNTVVMHYGILYDKPALEKVGYTFKAKVIDSIALSYYLSADRKSHGLEDYGVDYGVEKVKVDDSEWLNMTYERAVERCEQDVRININLWVSQLRILRQLYKSDEEVIRCIWHLNFNMEVLRIQEENPMKLDMDLLDKNIEILSRIVEEKSNKLKECMPPVPVIIKKTKPKNPFKKPTTKPKKIYTKSGEVTPAGEKWFKLLEERGLPLDHEEPITELSSTGKKWFELLKLANLPEDYNDEVHVIKEYKEPNPSSGKQMKEWLFSLGWKPCTFEKSASTGKPVPQVNDKNKELTPSIKRLSKKHPELEILGGLSVANHRLGFLKGFKKHAVDGHVVARASKLTRTLRLCHAGAITNVPARDSAHGELIRICLDSPDGYLFTNADLDSLESKCSNIAVTPFATKDYLEKPPGYDPHIEVSQAAGLLTQDQADLFKWYKTEDRLEEEKPDWVKSKTDDFIKEQVQEISEIRSIGKQVNYSALYGIGATTLSKNLGITKKEAQAILDAYWSIHSPVVEFTKTLEVKEVQGKTWVYNKFIGLWINFDSDHRKFNAVIQSFGACVHLRLGYFYIKSGIKPIASIHDEYSWYTKEGEEQRMKEVVEKSVDMLNKSFNFDIKFSAAPEFANSYGEVH